MGCTVRVVTDPLDADIHAALRLYENRIPEEERFEALDIVRWLREDLEQRQKGVRGPRDFFLVAKSGNLVCAFLLFHYHSHLKLIFVAYLVAEKGLKVDDTFLSLKLLEKAVWLLNNDCDLQECFGILLEVDDPRTAATADERRERLARIRLFCMLSESIGLTLRILDFKYVQPLVRIPAPDESGSEVQMLLMQATRKHSPKDEGAVGYSYVCELLKFIYLQLYPEGFSAFDSENDRYRRYVAGCSPRNRNGCLNLSDSSRLENCENRLKGPKPLTVCRASAFVQAA